MTELDPNEVRTRLRNAITDYSAIIEDEAGHARLDDDLILSDWLIVANFVSLEGDNSTYRMLPPNLNTPAHVVSGLAHVALHGHWDDPEEH